MGVWNGHRVEARRQRIVDFLQGQVVERNIEQVGHVKHVVIEFPQLGEPKEYPLGVLWSFANKT